MSDVQQAGPLEGASAQAILESIEKTSGASLDLVSQFMQQQKESITEAEALVDPAKRQQMASIRNAKFSDVQKSVDVDRKDIAQIVADFLTKADSVGQSFELLEKNTPEELAELENRKQAVTDADTAVTNAGGAWTFGGILGDPKAAADSALATAKKSLAEYEIFMKSEVRRRVIEATPQESLTTIQLLGERTFRALDLNKKVLILKQAVATASRKEAYTIQGQMETRLNTIDTEMQTLDTQLNTVLDKDERASTADTQGKAQQLRQAIELKRNEFNAALVIKNEASKDALEYGGMEVSLTQTVGAIDTMMHATAMKNRGLPRKMDIFTNILQGGAVTESSTELANMGDRTQMRMMERTAQVGQASVNARQGYFAAQPGRLEERKNLRISQDEARIATLKQDEVIYQQLKDAGIDIERMFSADRDSAGPAAQ